MPVLLCFGDSNTWGTCPMAHLDDSRRLPREQRWPGVLHAGLGADWQVIEEGLPGRTIDRDDPVEGADRNAMRMLPALLESHRPLDRVIVMLGTNDCKARFAPTTAGIAAGLHTLVDAIAASARPGMPAPRLLLVCPPGLREHGCLAPMFTGGEAISARLPPVFAQVAQQRGVDWFDAGSVAAVDAEDGIHLDGAAHLALGRALRTWVAGSGTVRPAG